MTGVGYNQMERLIMLGTGNALVTRCYNTCFAIQDDDEYFLVDAGGGNGIIRQLQDADISMAQIHHIFLTHEHTDHLLGMIWMIRMIATKMRREQYEGNLRIYCHSGIGRNSTNHSQSDIAEEIYKTFGSSYPVRTPFMMGIRSISWITM